MSTSSIILDSNLREKITHGTSSFPIQYYVDELHFYQDQSIPLHWHPELEFYICSGGMIEIQIDSTIITLNPGCGIFLNSNVLHSFHQMHESDRCECPNIVFSDELIAPVSGIIHQAYVKPLIINTELPFIVLCPNIPWQQEILDRLDIIFSLLQKYGSVGAYGQNPFISHNHTEMTSTCYEMQVQSELSIIWQLIYSHLPELPHTPVSKAKHLLQVRMQKMLTFIYSNYAETITLSDIANAASISKSEASRCFHSYLHTSPVNYLLQYRIEKARKLLLDSSKSIQEIALTCGFCSASYFCKIFRKQTGMTAAQYRKN